MNSRKAHQPDMVEMAIMRESGYKIKQNGSQ